MIQLSTMDLRVEVKMTYVKVEWLHAFHDEPVIFFSELGEDRCETRKVQVYRSLRMEWADIDHETSAAGLSAVTFPDLAEISREDEFVACEISREEFEQVWFAARAGGDFQARMRNI